MPSPHLPFLNLGISELGIPVSGGSCPLMLRLSPTVTANTQVVEVPRDPQDGDGPALQSHFYGAVVDLCWGAGYSDHPRVSSASALCEARAQGQS